MSEEIEEIVLKKLSQEKWISHPYKNGTYIKRNGREWYRIHQHAVSQNAKKVGYFPDCNEFYCQSYGKSENRGQGTIVFT